MHDDDEFDKLNMIMFQKFMNANPHYATFYGIHEPYDWQMPDGNNKEHVGNTRDCARFTA